MVFISNLIQCLSEVFDDVVDMLSTDAQANGGRCDVLLGQFLRRELRVGGGVGVNHQALHIGHVSQQREDLQGIDELPGFFLTALYLEGEDRAAAVGIVFLVEGVVRMALEGGMMDGSHLRVLAEEVDHLQGILQGSRMFSTAPRR